MLAELTIENFAIIEHLTLAPDPGLNILTGETGAGKSIIIDAIGSLLGGKIDADMIRAGAEQGRVEAVFKVEPYRDNIAGEALEATLSEYAIEAEEGMLILSRDFSRFGRSVARVNGKATPQVAVQRLGQCLLNIHGQAEHLSILRSGYQLDLLDEYGRLGDLRRSVAEKVGRLKKLRKEIESLQQDERERARRIDLLSYQINEIKAANLEPGEEEELVREEKVLANRQQLIAGADEVYHILYSGSGDSPAAADLLSRVEMILAPLANLDPHLEEVSSSAKELRYQVEEIGRALRAYRDSIDSDPRRLQFVVERLELIRSLKRKYGSTIEEVLDYLRRAEEELERVSHSEERLQELQDAERALEVTLAQEVLGLSRARAEAADRLAQAVEQELVDLNLEKARFIVSLAQDRDETGSNRLFELETGEGARYAFDSTGIDNAEFLLAANVGEPPRPLAKIASGGEMSRVMLALKGVLRRADATPTLIFDEIDEGIGGRSGWVVGQKLWSLARHHQILCVTHLPQIASFADTHFSVQKQVSAGRTTTTVCRLAHDERVQELSAMFGGSQSSIARQNAEEMLAKALAWQSLGASSRAPLA